MTKLTIKFKRLLPEESVALLKDKETLKKVWRHRYLTKSSNSSAGSQTFKDYRLARFKTVTEFADFIEDLPKSKRYK